MRLATYVPEPDLDIRLGPRPYYHPVRTLGGTTVTDAMCFDQPWHLGMSVALSDVGGVNFWGGKTYVRGKGYTWLDDHGRIRPDGDRLQWTDRHGRVLLTEDRTVTGEAAPIGWRLVFAYALTAPAATWLGSPATHGRPGGAGYGGFFWRGAPGDAHAFTAGRDGEDEVNGSDEQWVAVTVGGAYTLVFHGLEGADRWFVRTGDYVGVCQALAFEHPLELPAGATVARRISVVVADGMLSRADAARVAAPPS
jgi:Methane oxygenase PmoA